MTLAQASAAAFFDRSTRNKDTRIGLLIRCITIIASHLLTVSSVHLRSVTVSQKLQLVCKPIPSRQVLNLNWLHFRILQYSCADADAVSIYGPIVSSSKTDCFLTSNDLNDHQGLTFGKMVLFSSTRLFIFFSLFLSSKVDMMLLLPMVAASSFSFPSMWTCRLLLLTWPFNFLPSLFCSPCHSLGQHLWASSSTH